MPSVTFTSSGTWTSVATSVDCQAWGEGGKGASGVSGSSGHGGGGGGGGAYAEETALAVTNGSNYTYTIGAGGTATNTVFPGDSVTVTAKFGASTTTQSGAAGGAAGSNGIAFAGGAGAAGQSGTGSKEGGGGGGAAGASGAGGNAPGPAGGTGTGGGGSGGAGGGTGGTGTVPGGGGGGGGKANTFSDPGGNGAGGQITLIYTSSVSGTATLAGAGTLTAAGTSATPGSPVVPQQNPGATWLRRFGGYRNIRLPWNQLQTIAGTATLAGAGTLAAFGSAPAPAVVNQWANSYGQGTAFTSITSALQSCVVPLTPAYSAGPGSGYPTAGNWLFAIASWTQDPQIINVHVGTGDDIHSYWREYPAAGSGGYTRTAISYTPNIARQVGNVYVAPDMEIAAINVLVVEVAGLGQWDTVVGTDIAYDAASTSISLSQAAGAQATFFIGAVGGDNASSGQAFLPSGWMGLATQTQTNGANNLADNILTAAYLPSSNSAQNVSGSAVTAENLSGFMLAVLVSGNSPIPAGHNPDWPYVIFEAGFGAGYNTPDSQVTWTDITQNLWDWNETTGIQYQLGQLQATNLTMHLDDLSGYLIPSNASSPYYPDVQPGTPVRIRAALGTMAGVSYNRWYIIQRNATQWGEGIDEVFRRYCPVSGTDLWAALSSTPPTFYRSEIYEDKPYAWWPCDDQPGTAGVLPTQMLNAAIGNTNTLNIKLSPSGGVLEPYYAKNGADTSHATVGGSGAAANTSSAYPPGIAVYAVGADAGWMPGDPQSSVASLGTGNPVTSTPGSAAWQASGQAGNTGSFGWYLICNDNSFPALSGGVTVEIWFNAAYYLTSAGWSVGVPIGQPGGESEYPITAQPYNSPITIWEIATNSAPTCLLQLDTSGHLNLITAGTSHSIYTASDLRSNSWHMVTVTLTTTAWQVWLDGGANANVSGTASMASAWTYFIANGDFGSSGGGSPASLVHGGNISLSHIAIYPCVLPYYRVLDHYWAAITAFGQLAAPTGVQVAWVEGVYPATGAGQSALQSGEFVPDGSLGGPNIPLGGGILGAGGYNASSGTGISVVVTAAAPGITSGPSAWLTSATSYAAIAGADTPLNNVFPWVSWSGVAPLFNVYTSINLGSETQAAVVCGNGDSFSGGYGGSATGNGFSQVSGGNGSVPPVAASAIGDTVGQRIERLMRGGRCTSPNRCIDPAPLLVQAPGVNGGGQQVGAEIQAIQQSDGGMLYIDNCNHLTYWQRPHLASQYSSPVWNIGPTTSAGRIPYYKDIEWVTDPQRVWNVITITPLSPTGAALPEITPSSASAVNSSQIRYGAQPLAITSYLQSTAEMQNQADWLLSNFGTPQRHAENVKIDAAAYPQAWELVLGVNVGDLITLEDWEIGGGGSVQTYRVTEIQRHITMGFGDNPATTGSVTLTLDAEPSSYWA